MKIDKIPSGLKRNGRFKSIKIDIEPLESKLQDRKKKFDDSLDNELMEDFADRFDMCFSILEQNSPLFSNNASKIENRPRKTTDIA